jgi:hypothetical protein
MIPSRRLLLLSFLLVACKGDDAVVDDTGTPADDTSGGDDSATDTNPSVVPDTYSFVSAFGGGSSVGYDGQTFRHLLIEDMKAQLSGLTGRIDDGELFPVSGDIEAELNFYFEFDSDTSGLVPHQKSTSADALQTTYDELSSGKDLIGKIAGNDAVGQHKDWSNGLVGWDIEGDDSPERLVRAWFASIDAAAVARANGEVPLDPRGQPITKVFLDPQGRDHQQLLEKFLRGAVAFSQGADDYLDDDLEGKGLNADHRVAEEGKPWTALEHAWDEGFGYFGASVAYGSLTDDQIAAGDHDANQDGKIDLLTEVSWGHSGNAAKRDLGASATAPTDYTAEAWAGFAGGRALLAETAGQGLSADQLTELKAHRDQALLAWERAIAASVVHYINAVLADMAAMDTEAYSFADHAKHWSEGKGFALAFQFNPRSPLSDADFATLHSLLGEGPALESADAEARAAYADDLRAARQLLGETYGFAAENLGDSNGDGGW